MEQTNKKNSFESEGLRAHIFLNRERTRAPRWKYQPSSRLTVVLAEEEFGWQRVESTSSRPARVAPQQLPLAFDLQTFFQSMADWWSSDTGHMSNLIKASNHPAYQRIIGMGKVAPVVIIPLILRELEQRPDHWFMALHEISNEDPAQPEDDFDEAREAWLNWGRRRGYLR